MIFSKVKIHYVEIEGKVELKIGKEVNWHLLELNEEWRE